MSRSSGLSAAEDVYSRPETIKKRSNHNNNASSTTTTTMGLTEAADKTFLGGDISTDWTKLFPSAEKDISRLSDHSKKKTKTKHLEPQAGN